MTLELAIYLQTAEAFNKLFSFPLFLSPLFFLLPFLYPVPELSYGTTPSTFFFFLRQGLAKLPSLG